MKKIMHKVMSISLSLLLILTAVLSAGCSAGTKVDEKIPELLDSLSEGSSFRKVDRRDIGIPKVILCDAVMASYPVFFSTNVTLGKLFVNPGDHVKKGDIVASINAESLEKERQQLQGQLDHNERAKAITERINAAYIKEMEYEEKALREAGEIADANAKLKELTIKREDARFDSESFTNTSEELKKDIALIDETIGKGKLYAPHDGIVTYVTDISQNATINSNVAVAVISDEKDIYLEARDMDITEFNPLRSRTGRVYINGKAYEASELEYSSEEADLCKVNKKYPHVRFSVKGASLKAGDQLPVYMLPKMKENVIAVGTDSVYTNESEPYVYVKNGSDVEKRTVKTGAKDKNYIEITEGLSEGEEVFYQDSSELPGQYEEYKAEMGLFDVQAYSKTVSGYGISDRSYKTEYAGKVTMNVKKGEAVEQGDTLYTLKVEISNAELVEAENLVSSINTHHNETIKELGKREAAVKAELAEIEEERKRLAELDGKMKPADGNDSGGDDPGGDEDTDDGDDDGSEDEQEGDPKFNDYMPERLNAELEAIHAELDLENENFQTNLRAAEAERDRLRKRNGGQGEIKCTASASGTVRSTCENGTVIPDSVLCTVSEKEDDLILVMMRKTTTGSTQAAVKKGLKRYAMPGQTVTLESGGNTYTGKCTATNGYNMPCMAGTRDGRAYVVDFGEISGYMFAGYEFFADFSDGKENSDENKNIINNLGKDDTVTFSEVRFEDVISIPSAAIHEERDSKDDSKQHYVWTVVDGSLVKRYVSYDKKFDSGEFVFIPNGLLPGDVIAVEKTE